MPANVTRPKMAVDGAKRGCAATRATARESQGGAAMPSSQGARGAMRITALRQANL
jgi:hypothetical protein